MMTESEIKGYLESLRFLEVNTNKEHLRIWYKAKIDALEWVLEIGTYAIVGLTNPNNVNESNRSI